MRAPNEVRVVSSVEDTVLQIARDLFGLLGCTGLMIFLLFLAGGM